MAARWLTQTDLPPDVFAIVMATGIVSVAADDHHYHGISDGLGAVAAAVFVLLALGLVIRVVARPRSALGEVTDPDVAFRLFTSVAACAVLGARFDGDSAVVWVLGALGAAAWLLLSPLALRDVATRPRAELRDHAHGAWLLPSVGTAGLAITAADLAVHARSIALLIVGTVLWLLGLAVYLAVTWLIVWHALDAPFEPDVVTPDSWILMGALAIGTLAGDHVLRATRALQAAGLAGWVSPLTLVVWAAAGLWIPVLLYAEVWSVDNRIGALHYTRVWWSAVFPLGMYASATAAAAVRLHLRSLTTISLVFFWVAFAVWVLVATGLVQIFLAARLPSRRRRTSGHDAGWDGGPPADHRSRATR